MNAEMQALSDAEDRELLDRLTPSTDAEIETAIRVVQRINYGAAYGRDPELCRSTAKTLGALRAANAAGEGAAKPYPAPAGSPLDSER
jgi:hypothetical protein